MGNAAADGDFKAASACGVTLQVTGNQLVETGEALTVPCVARSV